MSDPYIASVKLLLHNDAGFTDFSPVGRAITATGGVSLSSAQSEFGGSSALFDGASGYLSAASSTDFNIGTGDFTIEAAVYATSTSGVRMVVARQDVGSLLALEVRINAGNYEVVLRPIGGGSVVTLSCGAVSANAWHTLAVARSGSTVYGFLDGALVTSSTFSGSLSASGSRPLTVGALDDGTVTSFFQGYIDEVRLTVGVARFTATYTPDTAAFPDNVSTAAVVMPAATLAATGTMTTGHATVALLTAAPSILGSFGGGASMAAPQPVVRAYAGGASGASMPSPTLLAYCGSVCAISLAAPALAAQGHDSTGDNSLTYTLNSSILGAYGGANASLASPSSSLASSAAGTNWGVADMGAPSTNVAAAGTVSATAQADLRVPMAALVGYSGAVCSITLTGSPTLQASGTAGSISHAALTLPLFELTVSGTDQNHGSAELVAPAGRMAGTLQTYIIAPMATLIAIGSAVVTATYEAYAINLNHTAKPGDNTAPVDEMTRYTNFPFTQIVRYQNSYFGVAADGLYLLEGTVDVATPIPFAVKTATTDFKSPFQKTVASAYFAGRLGAANTVTLYAGEGAQVQPYSYTTPRGALAQNHRQAFGKGIKAHRYYALGLAGTGELALDGIELDTHDMKRRI